MFGDPKTCLSLNKPDSTSCPFAHGVICALKSESASLVLLSNSVPSLPLFGENLFIEFMSTGNLNQASELLCRLQSSVASVQSLQIPSQNISYSETTRVFEVFIGLWRVDLYRKYHQVQCEYSEDPLISATWIFPEATGQQIKHSKF